MTNIGTISRLLFVMFFYGVINVSREELLFAIVRQQKLLVELLAHNGQDFLAPDVYDLSRELDKLIVQYLKEYGF